MSSSNTSRSDAFSHNPRSETADAAMACIRTANSPAGSTPKEQLRQIMQAALNQLVEDYQKQEHAAPNHHRHHHHHHDADAAAYIEALEKAPHLIQQESDPVLFLNWADGNIETACQRFLKYWTFRRKVFSPGAAYKPLPEALSAEAIKVIRAGTIAMLPQDKQGHSVVLLQNVEHCMTDKFAGNVGGLQAAFFVLSQVALNPKTQHEGFVMILSFPAKRSSCCLPHAAPLKELRAVQESLPLKVYQRHIACIVTLEERALFANEIVPAATGGLEYKIHLGDSPKDLLLALQEFGLKKEALPEFLGGTWDALVDELFALSSRRSAEATGKSARARAWSEESEDDDDEDSSKKPAATVPVIPLEPITGVNHGNGSLPDKKTTATAAFATGARPFALAANAPMQVVLQRFVDEFKSNPIEAKVDAAAYIEALDKAPHLINQESNPGTFWRWANGDAEAAAHRLLQYWTHRRNIFGFDHVYKSLLDGNALGPTAREYVRFGMAALLPNDSHGHSVLYFDLQRCPPRPPSSSGGLDQTQARMQAAFYLVSLLALNPKSQSEGFVSVVLLCEKATGNMPHAHRFFELVEEAMPLKVHSRHMACVPPEGGRRAFLDELVPVLDDPDSKGSFPDFTIHISHKMSDLASKLEPHGFEKEKLPKSLGGSWDYRKFYAFLDEEFSHNNNNKPSAALPGKPLLAGAVQMAASLEIPPPPPQVGWWAPPIATNNLLSATITQPSLSTIKQSSCVVSALPDVASLAKSEADDKSDQDEKSPTTEGKVPLKGIKLPYCGIPVVDEYNGLFSENSVKSLETALKTKPGECFDKGTNEEEQADFIRKRNAVYSRRKYYKKKLKIESLQASKDKLEQENKELRDEGRRLELLLYQAHRRVAMLPQRQNLFAGTSQDPFVSSLAAGTDLSQEALALSLLGGILVARGLAAPDFRANQHPALGASLLSSSSSPAASITDPFLHLLLLQESSAAATAAQPFLPTGAGPGDLSYLLMDASQRSSVSNTNDSQQQRNLQHFLDERMLLDERIRLGQVRSRENELIAALTGTTTTTMGVPFLPARSNEPVANDRLLQQLVGGTRFSSSTSSGHEQQDLLTQLLWLREQQQCGSSGGMQPDCDFSSLHSPPPPPPPPPPS